MFALNVMAGNLRGNGRSLHSPYSTLSAKTLGCCIEFAGFWTAFERFLTCRVATSVDADHRALLAHRVNLNVLTGGDFLAREIPGVAG
ncbi:hypothetical protein Pla22_24470 [Rubripirellula amarantea]|uniref:Uncharacterized protein n=1 Tax=Rubripirellula amarantea TaxID=2527999 RepID=A0A5C5WXR5_9BACT|nr:hypothetical protein [Rubripirellula amarantea]TWT54793.1 hypothetical protein Pla22_24470 [Rubripirellula amarantea]